MSDRDARIREMAARRVVYRIAGMDDVQVRTDEQYEGTSRALPMDLYYPPGAGTSAAPPLVAIAMGYPDPQGFHRRMGWAVSWARLIAASGMAAVIYGNEQPDADLLRLIAHARAHGASLGIDPARIAALGASGGGPAALAAIVADGRLACGALLYPFTMDLDGATATADAARQFGFADACAGWSADDLPLDVPLFFVRAGRDQFAGLNDALDRFIAKALARNLPVTLVNHATGPHAFDLDDDSDTSREVIRQTLAFLGVNLGVR